jgi:DNA-binding MarR family transcriptional regulator
MATAAAVNISHLEADPAQSGERLSTLPDAPAFISPGTFPRAAEDLSDQELRAWRGLLRAHASLAKLLDAELEDQHGLPMTSYEVLQFLAGAERGRMRMCDLAEQAQMSRSGLTRLVDRLERDGLLERCSCEHDARGAYACLTASGRERLCEARSTHRSVVREHFLSRFSAQELSSLAELWERIAPCCGGPSC